MELQLIIFLVVSAHCYAEVSDKQYAKTPIIFHNDNYDHCMLREDEALYCQFTYELTPLDPTNVTDVWKTIVELNSSEHNYRHDKLRHGICVPETCPTVDVTKDIAKEINRCYDQKFRAKLLKGTVTEIVCETTKPRHQIDLVDISAGLFFIAYTVFVIYASICESLVEKNSKEDYDRFLSTTKGRICLAFSIPRNWKRLGSSDFSNKTEKLRPIQGIRFYYILVLIFIHVYLGEMVGPVANTKYPETWLTHLKSPILLSGFLGLGLNFFLSTFLLTYGIYTEFEEKEFKFKTIFLILFVRSVRLLPALAASILFFSTVGRHLGNGPFWYHYTEKEILYCRKNGWINLLFLNKLINYEEMCFPHTWYLALDSQYFLLAVILLWIFKRNSKLIWPTLIGLLILCTGATFIENYTWNFEAMFYPTPETAYGLKVLRGNTQWHYQVTSFSSNAIGSIMGMGMGYLFYKNADLVFFEKYKPFITKYSTALTLGPVLAICMIPGMLCFRCDMKHSAFWASMYNAFGRFIYTFGACGGLILASRGYSEKFKSLLEWPPSSILSRLSYTAYIIHIGITWVRNGLRRFPTYINDLQLIYYAMGDAVLSYMAALLLTLLFEMPMSSLLKRAVPHERKVTEKKM